MKRKITESYRMAMRMYEDTPPFWKQHGVSWALLQTGQFLTDGPETYLSLSKSIEKQDIDLVTQATNHIETTSLASTSDSRFKLDFMNTKAKLLIHKGDYA